MPSLRTQSATKGPLVPGHLTSFAEQDKWRSDREPGVCRWLGHGTMLIISLHGLGYYVVWLDQGNWTGGLSWNASNTNLLAGTLAWLCGCILWASSITWVRRNFYEVHIFLRQQLLIAF